MSRTAGQIVAASNIVISRFRNGSDKPERALFALIDILDNEENVVADDDVDMAQFDVAVNAIVSTAYKNADEAVETEAPKATAREPKAPSLAEQMPKNGTP
jgi:hypothetical protein